MVRTHGRMGEVVAQPVRGLPSLLRPGMLVALTPPALDRDRFCTVESVREVADGALVAFSGISDMTASEAIVGCTVLASSSDLDLGALDAPYDELIGRVVVDDRYGEVGSISEVMETPANDVWVVQGRFGEVLVPVIEDVVSEIPRDGDIEVKLLDGLIDPAALEGSGVGA